MQLKLSNPVPPIVFNAVVWLCGVTLLLLLKNALVAFFEAIDDDSLELNLAMALCAYVLLFLLEPLRNRIDRRLKKRNRRRANRHRS
ncbi:hypothetical protein [Pseudomonas tolaasii]|uniref:hypothetical protein n=1 Tax=Pseudomonas tolaasii TaxID=29442 RepID=UPI001C5CF1DB|nr:hypothetical protein [Pseudomonas tolaasii]MBW4793993.1 hypothetical protein [Pseudomonas tolaasii]